MAQDTQQNPEQAYQKPPRSGFRVFAGKLFKGLLIGAAIAAAAGALCLIPAIGVPVAGALVHVPLLGSLVGTHIVAPAAALFQTHAAFVASMSHPFLPGAAAAAIHTVPTVAWGALLGVGAAVGGIFGGVVGIFKGERQSKQNKMEQAMARAQQQEQSMGRAPQQAVAQGQGTTVNNPDLTNMNNQVPDVNWQQRVTTQRQQQQTAASVPPL